MCDLSLKIKLIKKNYLPENILMEFDVVRLRTRVASTGKKIKTEVSTNEIPVINNSP